MRTATPARIVTVAICACLLAPAARAGGAEDAGVAPVTAPHERSPPAPPARTSTAIPAPATAGERAHSRPSARPPGSPPGLAALSGADTAQAVRIVLGLTALALLPALLVCVSSFLRIIVVLSMLRQAMGMNETPPNVALIGLALFLTLFTMSPTLERMNRDALQPFMEGKVSVEAGYDKAVAPLREFMMRQTREQDLALMIELSRAPLPRTIEETSSVQLVPAFMLSELRAAYQIGFVVFLPFLLIDLVVSSVLMSLGMLMMPPVTISLPLKILMFVLVDGWSLLLRALVGSFH